MHPLMKPAAWALWTGASGMPAVRWAGALFWLLGGAALGLWLAGLLHEAMVWGVPTLLLMSGLAVAAGWVWLAWSTWSAWCADQKRLTLLWTGPLPPDEGADGQGRGQGGFRVVQWHAAVRVEVLLDLQRWMLLRVSAAQPSPQHPVRQAWLWLQHAHETEPAFAQTVAQAAAQAGGAGKSSLHQLRTLLHLPAQLTTAPAARAAGMAPPDGGAARMPARAMASWAHSIKSGLIKLRATPHSPRMPGQRPVSVHTARESCFPSTVVMRDEDLGDVRVPRHAEGRS